MVGTGVRQMLKIAQNGAFWPLNAEVKKTEKLGFFANRGR